MTSHASHFATFGCDEDWGDLYGGGGQSLWQVGKCGDEGAGRRSRHGEATAVDQQQVPRLIGLKSAHFHPRPAHVLGSVRVCELK